MWSESGRRCAVAALAVVAVDARGATVDAAASVRLRYEGSDAAFLGPPAPDRRDVLLVRALAGARAESPRGHAAYLQLGWHDEAGRDPRPLPTDVDGLDLQQAYVDVALEPDATLRLGRQEVALGSARLVGVRDSPNVRRAFDGGTFTVASGEWRLRTLLLATVAIESGAFDDSSDGDTWLGGVYATRTTGEGRSGVDLYALRYGDTAASFGIGVADERRWSFGVRAFGERGTVDYDWEAVVQTGRFGARTIRAWTVASNTGLTLDRAPGAPRLGVKANVTSGDRDPADGRLGTFNALFPNLAYFSQAATIAPQNHADLQLSVTWPLATRGSLGLIVDRFWRTTTADTVYRANGAPYPVASRDRDVARQFELVVDWNASRALEARASVLYWSPSGALQAAGAERTWFVMAQVTARL